MEYIDKEYCLEVRGDFACFTRPELKVERVSYDVITPSAARAIFQALFWKPAIQWRVTRIEVLNPIKHFSIKRNEVGSTMSHKSKGLFVEENRQQRTSYILRDVAYRIFARMEFIPIRDRKGECLEESLRRQELRRQAGRSEDENPGKYQAIFERRASKGQFFTPPYLGCREFSCSVEWIPDAIYNNGIDETRDLGIMLYDMDFESNPNCPPAMFFRAMMRDGVIEVPQSEEEILR